MEKTIVLKIDCGETTCAKEKGKFCQFVGVRRFGTISVCLLFPSESNSFTDLSENEHGWIARCEACLEHTQK